MSQAELDSLYKGHSGDNSEQQNSFYYESGIAGQSLLQRHLMQANVEEDGSGTVTDGGVVSRPAWPPTDSNKQKQLACGVPTLQK